MPDGISRPYTKQGRKNYDEIFKNDIIPERIKKELKRLDKAEKMREYRRRKFERSIKPEILETYYADKKPQF